MRIDELTVSQLVQSLGAKTPTPGGGAAASVTASLAAALAQMVVRFSQGKKKLAEHEPLYRETLAVLEGAAADALELAEHDATAYAKLNELWKLDKNDPGRQREWSGAVQAAIEAPSSVLDLSLRIIEQLRRLAGCTNRMLDSDLAIAAVLANAAAQAAAWNVRINLPLVENPSQREAIERDLQARMKQSREQARSITDHCSDNVL